MIGADGSDDFAEIAVPLLQRVRKIVGVAGRNGEKRGTVTNLVNMITRNGQIDAVWQDHDGTVSSSGTESPHVHYAFNEAMDYHRQAEQMSRHILFKAALRLL